MLSVTPTLGVNRHLVWFVADPGFFGFPVNFDLAISQVRRHAVLESPSPGVSNSLLAGVARPYRSDRDLDHRSTQVHGTYLWIQHFSGSGVMLTRGERHANA